MRCCTTTYRDYSECAAYSAQRYIKFSFKGTGFIEGMFTWDGYAADFPQRIRVQKNYSMLRKKSADFTSGTCPFMLRICRFLRKGKSNSAMNHFLPWTVRSISVPCEHTLIIKGKCIHSFLTILCLWSFWSPMYRPSGGTFFPISVAFLRWLTR